MGDIHARGNRSDQSIAAYEDAAALDVPSPLAHAGAARGWQSFGRYDLAEKYLRRALEIQDSADLRLQLAQALFRREMQNPAGGRQWSEFEKALRDAKASKIEPGTATAWQLDLLEIQANRVRPRESADTATARRESLSQFKALEDKYPNTPALLETLISCYESLPAPDEADRVLSQIQKLKPGDPHACVLQAQLAFSRRQFDGAERRWRRDCAWRHRRIATFLREKSSN